MDGVKFVNDLEFFIPFTTANDAENENKLKNKRIILVSCSLVSRVKNFVCWIYDIYCVHSIVKHHSANMDQSIGYKIEHTS